MTDGFGARTAAARWQAQERWRFKSQIFTRALTTLKQMRQPLELAATPGTSQAN